MDLCLKLLSYNPLVEAITRER
uniref:Uncharacterized protein n=1 Tax=Anguilla anguilla TaxID=7936 RepID=A0A0E9RL54_ANGAN